MRAWATVPALLFGALASAEPASTPLLRVSGVALADVVSKQVGAEAAVGYHLAPPVEVGVGATFGAITGARVLLGVSPMRWGRFSPFVQARGVYFPSDKAWGGGLQLGVEVALGPGSVLVGVVGELYSGPAAFHSQSVSFALGYAFDLIRTTPVTSPAPAPVVATPTPVAPSPTAPQPNLHVIVRNTKGAATVRVADLPDGATCAADPDCSLVAPPGEHRVVAIAPGYLVQGFSVRVTSGAVQDAELSLRAAPARSSVTVEGQSLKLSAEIRFAKGEARLLTPSLPVLDEIADLLLRRGNLRLRVGAWVNESNGHANRELAERRAYFIAEYLIAHGVAEDHVTALAIPHAEGKEGVELNLLAPPEPHSL